MNIRRSQFTFLLYLSISNTILIKHFKKLLITLEYTKKNYLYKQTKNYASFKTKNLNVVNRVTSQCLFGPMTISKRYTNYP